MISATSAGFKHIDRGKERTVALVPGWASDYRVFSRLDLDFNYLVPAAFSPPAFGGDLLAAREERGIEKISLFGWSLGGFAAQEFAVKHPEIIDELILVSIRERYKKDDLDVIRENLKKGKEAYLYKFYSQCFYDRERWSRFKRELLRTYLRELDLNYLLSALDYLESAEIKPEELKKIDRIKIMHAQEDRIAPVEEALAVSARLPRAEFVCVPSAGHLFFYE